MRLGCLTRTPIERVGFGTEQPLYSSRTGWLESVTWLTQELTRLSLAGSPDKTLRQEKPSRDRLSCSQVRLSSRAVGLEGKERCDGQFND